MMADKKSQREQRLAAALRENLKRRKTQAREIAPGNPATKPSGTIHDK